MHTKDKLERLAVALTESAEMHDDMSIVELDGFVAGIVVCPELIPASEWLSEACGKQVTLEASGDAGPELVELMEHYDCVANQLAQDPKAYAPIFELDEHSGDVLWMPWVVGFDRAMGLRGEAWERIVRSDDRDAATAIFLLTAVSEMVDGKSELSKDDVEKFNRRVPILIPKFVRDLYAWTNTRAMGADSRGDALPAARTVPDPAKAYGRRVGRNEPCPCGSGRKYKRCCGAH